MATNDPTRPRQPLTKFAQKYGVFKDTSKPYIIDLLQGYKSGHTPISAYSEGESCLRSEWKSKIAGYQEFRHGGFPVDWIRALRAYIPTADIDFASDWTKSELHNAIHPLIDKDQWETLDGCLQSYPPPMVGDGFSGFMVVSVPLLVQTVVANTK